jgi:hypothetical protein
MSKIGGLKLAIILFGHLSVVGCQSLSPSEADRYNNGAFMELWQTYMHCLRTTDLTTASLVSSKLHSAAEISSHEAVPNIVPIQLRKNLGPATSRLAVDLQSMAVACSIHAGDVAMSAGDFDTARIHYKRVLIHQDTLGEAAYYISQARAKLEALELSLQASIRWSDSLPFSR